jgi:hypothetical protein
MKKTGVANNPSYPSNLLTDKNYQTARNCKKSEKIWTNKTKSFFISQTMR